QPAESMSFGRLFPLARENRVTLQVRIEFQNIFNRTFYQVPSTGNPQALTQRTNPFPNGQLGALASGFGYVNTIGGGVPMPGMPGAMPRTGQFIARIQF